MSKPKFTTWKYINPETGEHYYTISQQWDEIYDGKWDYDKDELIIEVKLHPKDNYLI